MGTAAMESHAHAHEDAEGHSHGAFVSGGVVALDIGNGRGALVIYPDERFRGREIEISRAGGDGLRVHTGVHVRGARSGSSLTAVFGSLPAGEYVIWEDATRPAGNVRVPDGAVAEIALS